MGRLASAFRRAVVSHRDAVAHAESARRAVVEPLTTVGVEASAQVREVVDRLRLVGEGLTPGWLGTDLISGPVGGFGSATGNQPVLVRVGSARPAPDLSFRAVVPLLGGAHLAFDTDGRNGRVGGVLRCLLVRLIAACAPGGVRVLTADQAALGGIFRAVRPLVQAGVVAEPATSDESVQDLLAEAEQHVRAAQAGTGDGTWLVVVFASAPAGHAELARLAALSHAGRTARVCVIVAGWPQPVYGVAPPVLGAATMVRLDGGGAWLGDPPGESFSAGGAGMPAPVLLDASPSPAAIDAVAAYAGEGVRRAAEVSFTDLIPAERWSRSSIDGLHAVVGRAGRTSVELAFDDVTPHWLVGGRTGAGKTVFLLDVLYTLAARYSPDELALYLLDFKEGISFTEFTPTRLDPSWIPHARAVGVESDREYGVAVLAELRREMNRRATVLKQYGVAKLSDLRRGQTDIALPRVVAVVDEFQVLFTGNDRLAADAAALLEDLARKGRSYGIHLVLASQTASGVEALYGKTEAIFGQFPMRVALPGGSSVLETLNTAADGIPLGTAIINPAAGLAAANQTVRFPDAHADQIAVAALRHDLWRRPPGSSPPAVFHGFAPARLDDDPTYRALRPDARRPRALVGRAVDVQASTAGFPLDATPGRHVAVVGTTDTGADVLHAATVSLARQHPPGTVRFLLAPLVAPADQVLGETVAGIEACGHPITTVDTAGLREQLRKLADPTTGDGEARRYLIVFGVDAAGAALGLEDRDTFRTGRDDLQAVLRHGPAYGIHLLGWWRGVRRLADDLSGSTYRDDIACLVALNVPAVELGLYLDRHDLTYTPRANRGLLVDGHDLRTQLIVPFTRPGHHLGEW